MHSATFYDVDDYESLLVALQTTLGVVVSEGQRNNLLARIEPLLTSFQFASLADLARSLQRGQPDGIKSRVLDVISQHHSAWSLTAEMKKVLDDYVITQLPEKAKVWMVGCGQGQLAYAVAMEIATIEHESGINKDLRIIASDVSADDISVAQAGVYGPQQLAAVNDDYKKLYFSQDDSGRGFRVKEKIRQAIEFRQCDLTGNFHSLGKMDLIICPDVLVYFSNGIKAGILQQFSALLKPGGIFLAGYNQAIVTHAVLSREHGLERVEHPAGVFYRKKAQHSAD